MDSLPSVVMHSDLVMDQFNRLYAQLCGGSAESDVTMGKGPSCDDEVPSTDYDEAYDDADSEGPQDVAGGVVTEEEDEEEGRTGAGNRGDRDGSRRRGQRREENVRTSVKPDKAQAYASASDEEQEEEPPKKQVTKQGKKRDARVLQPQERRSEQAEGSGQTKPPRPKHRPSALEMLFGAGEEDEDDYAPPRVAAAPSKGTDRRRTGPTKAPGPVEEGRSKSAAKSGGGGKGQAVGTQNRTKPPPAQPPLQEVASKQKQELTQAAVGPANILVPRKRQRNDTKASEGAAPKGGSSSKKRPRGDSGLQKGRVPSREEAEEEDIVSESEESEDSEEEEEGNGGKAAGKGKAQGQRERKPPAVKKGAEKGQQTKGGAGKAQADKQAKKPPAKASAKQKQGKSPSEHLPAAVANGRKDGSTGKATGAPSKSTARPSKSPSAHAPMASPPEGEDVWRWDGDEAEWQEREEPRRRPPHRPILSPQAPEEVADAWSPCVPSVDAYSADTLRLSLQRHPSHTQAQQAQPQPPQPSNSGGKKRPRDGHNPTAAARPPARPTNPAVDKDSGENTGGSFFQRLGNRPAPEQRPTATQGPQSTQPRFRPPLPTSHPSPPVPPNPPSSLTASTAHASLKPPPFSPPAALRSPLPPGSNAKVSPGMGPQGAMAGWNRGGGNGTPSPASSTNSWSVPSPAPQTLASSRRPTPGSDPLLLGTLFSPRPRFLPHQAPSLTSPSPLPRLTAFPPPPPSLFNLPGARK